MVLFLWSASAAPGPHPSRYYFLRATLASSLVAALVAALAPPPAAAQFTSPPTYAPRADFLTGDSPQMVAIGDLNGDGRSDIAVASLTTDRLNTTTPGSSTPTFSARVDLVTATQPRGVAIADLNRDGRLDLAVTNFGTSNVSVFLNTTAGGGTTPSFSTKTDFGVGNDPGSIAARDANADGLIDLIVGNQTAGTVSVLPNATLPNASTPAFNAHVPFTSGTLVVDVAMGDFNLDGLPDIATVNQTSTDVGVLLNNSIPGAGIIFSAVTSVAIGSAPRGLAVADFNGDGRPDLAVSRSGADNAAVRLNTTAAGGTTPSFAAAVTFGVGDDPYGVAAGDINGDGKPDLVVANQTGGSLSTLINTTTPGAAAPSFASKVDASSGAASQGVTIADLNGDGKRDAAVANRDADNASVFVNTTPSPSGSGALVSRALVPTGPDSLGLGRIASADVNSDGRPDFATTLHEDSVVVNLNTTAMGAITPTFGAGVPFAVTDPHTVALGDFNNDGRPDMAATVEAGAVTAWFNTTAPGASMPSFSAPQSFLTNGVFPTQVVIRDFNGDSKADLAVANAQGNSVSILRNTAASGNVAPNFDVKVDIPTCDPGTFMDVSDFNGDGRTDIAVPCDSGDVVTVLLNTTTPGALTPTFSRLDVPLTPVVIRPFGIATGDMNGDGKADLVIANNVSTPNGLAIMLNTTPTGAAVPLLAPRDLSRAPQSCGGVSG